MRTLRMRGGANDFVVYFIDKNYIVNNFFLTIYIKSIRIKYFMGVIIFLTKIFFNDKNVNGKKICCGKLY